MKVLFLCLSVFDSMEKHGIYTDLMREFYKHGHMVYAVSTTGKEENCNTHLIKSEMGSILKLSAKSNRGSNNIIQKGLSTLSLEWKIVSAIKKYYGNIEFDLIIYATPPITFLGAVKYIVKRKKAFAYLMLKDIFPQNAVDIGLLSKKGIKGIVYRFFRTKEKQLYRISSKIGCMSAANVAYLLEHNPEISPRKVEICPNCTEVQDILVSEEERLAIRKKYGIPNDKTVFVYGGNLGRPQGIPFVMECLRAQNSSSNIFFLIVGDGTEYEKLDRFIKNERPWNIKLLKRLPKEDYDRMIAACDVGLIFLDHRFTIPNFPSRLLSYMQAGLPILACTDVNTDVGKVIVDGGFGWWCESNNVGAFQNTLEKIQYSELRTMGKRSRKYLEDHYHSSRCYEIIMNAVLEKEETN